jgi:hypothetical protein
MKINRKVLNHREHKEKTRTRLAAKWEERREKNFFVTFANNFAPFVVKIKMTTNC